MAVVTKAVMTVAIEGDIPEKIIEGASVAYGSQLSLWQFSLLLDDSLQYLKQRLP